MRTCSGSGVVVSLATGECVLCAWLAAVGRTVTVAPPPGVVVGCVVASGPVGAGAGAAVGPGAGVGEGEGTLLDGVVVPPGPGVLGEGLVEAVPQSATVAAPLFSHQPTTRLTLPDSASPLPPLSRMLAVRTKETNPTTIAVTAQQTERFYGRSVWWWVA